LMGQSGQLDGRQKVIAPPRLSGRRSGQQDGRRPTLLSRPLLLINRRMRGQQDAPPLAGQPGRRDWHLEPLGRQAEQSI